MRVTVVLMFCLALVLYMYVSPVGGRRKVRKRCKPLSFPNTTRTCDQEPNAEGWYPKGTVCNFDCREGCVKDVGNRRRVCKVRGLTKWWKGGRGLRCRCRPCVGAPIHPEGYTSDCGAGTYPAGHTCVFTCPAGYVKASGNERKLCVNGRWRGEDLVCEAGSVDGGWSGWLDGPCSVTCGDGVMTQSRTCNNPSPAHGGAECTREDGTTGLTEERTVPCNPGPCPIDGGWSDWVDGDCSVTCGDGEMTQSRTCNNPEPAHGGAECTLEDGTTGLTEERTVPCNRGLCPIDTDECASLPCQNGGYCIGFVGGYACDCPEGYEGLHCETAACLVQPLYGESADEGYSRSSCVNYEVLLPEVTKLTRTLPRSLEEVGLSPDHVLRDLEELRHVGLIPFEGNIGPLTGGDGTRRRRSPPHWSRAGNVTSLVYNSGNGAEERLVAFAADNLEGLGENDELLGPLQSIQADIEGFPGNYPATTAEAVPFLVQDFLTMLSSFDCGGGSNCDRTRGQVDVIELNDRWSIVYRPALEYDPGSMKRAIRFRILIVAWRGFRIFIRCFIY